MNQASNPEPAGPVGGPPAEMTDLLLPALVDEFTGVFCHVDHAVLRRICAHATVETLHRGQVLFTHKTPTDQLPVYVLLEGEMLVQHLVVGAWLVVSTDQPGTMIGEVEYLTRGIGPEVTGRGKLNLAKAKLTCSTPEAKVLAIRPASVMYRGVGEQMHINMLRLLAIKLLRRNHVSDPKSVPGSQTRRVYLYLRSLVVHQELWTLDPDLLWESNRERTKGDVARALRIPEQTISSIYTRRLRAQGVDWVRGRLRVNDEFRARIIGDWRALAGASL